MSRITGLDGPILVLGASGFVGANLFRALLEERDDVFGTCSDWSDPVSTWRLEGISEGFIWAGDLTQNKTLRELFEEVQPKTVLNCLAYGAYPFQKNPAQIYAVNFDLTRTIVELCKEHHVKAYIHAGSSSEYGAEADAPKENTECWPNSHYAVSKAAASAYLRYEGKHNNFPCYNLRLYSVYGPYEDAKRLIPQVIMKGLSGGYPPFVDPNITRDFIYVKDVVDAFVDAAFFVRAKSSTWGDSLNVGTGEATNIYTVAQTSRARFMIQAEPTFEMPAREWDTVRGHNRWVADRSKIEDVLGWWPKFGFALGFAKTEIWAKKRGDFGPSKDTKPVV